MLTARNNQPMPAEQLQKLKHYKDVLHRMIPYLRVPEDRVHKEFNADKVGAFEKQIVNIMETFKRRREGVA
jgi:PAX-interacting protein 1